MSDEKTEYIVLRKKNDGLCLTHKGNVYDTRAYEKKAGGFSTEAEASKWISDVCDSAGTCK